MYNIIIMKCTSSHDNNVVSVSMSIEVVSGRNGTFRVTCTATGGTLSNSSLTGPGLDGGGLQLQAEGSIGRTGQNMYSITSDTLSGQSNGDNYTCAATNNVSSPEMSKELAGIGIIVVFHCTYKLLFCSIQWLLIPQ